jgi:protein-tyrosine phosphatase
MIFVATRGKQTNQQAHFTQVRSLESPYPDVSALITQQGHLLPPDAIAGERWLLADSNSANRIRQMELVGCPLSRYVAGKILLGIKTGLNKAFWLSRDEYKAIVRKQPQCAEILKPLLVGDDIRKWHMRDSASWLIYTPHGIDMSVYRAVVEHLRPWKDKLENRALDQQWYELQQPQFRYAAYFSKPKIVYPDIALESRFTLDVEKHYVDMTAFAIPSDDLFLLGVLNSSAVWAYLREKAAVLGDPAKRGRLRLKRQYLEQLPILTAPPNECSAITTLVQKCLDARGQGAGLADWEAEINERVARLYGLTPEEIKIVESASAEPAARQGKAAK